MTLPGVWWPTSGATKAAPAPKAGKAKRAAVKRIACPPLSAADKAALSSLTSRPEHWPDKGASKGELQAHVDALELGEAEKAAAAKRIISEHERCRGGGGKGK